MIDGFGISNYRSFGSSLQRFGPLGRVNLIIGQNNSGKSNVLRLAIEHLPGLLRSTLQSGTYEGFKPIDRHLGPGAVTELFAYGILLDGPEFQAWREQLYEKVSRDVRRSLDKLLVHAGLTQDQEIAWFDYEVGSGSRWVISSEQVGQLHQAKVLDPTDWFVLWNALTDSRGGDLREHWIPETLHKLR